MTSILNGLSAVARTGTFALFRVIGILAAALGSVVSASMLGPANLGVSAIVVAIVTVAALPLEVLSGNLMVRELQLSKEDEKPRLVWLVMWARLIYGFGAIVLSWMILFCWSLYEFRLQLSVATLLLLVRCASLAWAFQGYEEFRLLATFEAFVPISSTLLIWLLLEPGAEQCSDLVIQGAVGICGVVMMYTVFWGRRKWKWMIKDALDWRRLGALLMQGRFLFLVQVAIFGYVSSETLLLGFFLEPGAAGKYRSAQSLTQALHTLLAVLPMTMMPKYIQWRRISAKHLWEQQMSLFLRLAPLCLAGGLVGSFLVPLLFRIWFTDAFHSAAPAAVVLMWSKLIVVLNGIFIWGAISSEDGDRTIAKLLLCVAVLSSIVNFIVIPRFSFMGAAFVNLSSEVIVLYLGITLARRSAIGSKSARF